MMKQKDGSKFTGNEFDRLNEWARKMKREESLILVINLIMIFLLYIYNLLRDECYPD